MKFKKIKTLSFLEFVPPCPLMLVKRSKNLLKYDTLERQDSRGRLGKSRDAKSAHNIEIFPTNGPTWQGVESCVSD